MHARWGDGQMGRWDGARKWDGEMAPSSPSLLYQTVDELQKNTISNSDIEELITDIRASFELFVNNTPRPDDGKMKDLEERFNVLSEKFEALNLLSDEVEIIKKTSKAIPKLNITKRKII